MKLSKKKILILILASIIVIHIVMTVFMLEGNYIDEINIGQRNSLITFFKIITRLGDWYTILAIIVASFILKNKNYFKYIVINTALLVALNQLLKFIFQRPRPELQLISVSGYSFPSGHAMVNAGFYGFLIYLLMISKLNKKVKVMVCALLSILILLIGCSRIYLGVHYITDVVAGMCFAIIYLVFYINFVKNGDKLL